MSKKDGLQTMETFRPSLPSAPELEAFIRSSINTFASNKLRTMGIENRRHFLMTFGCCVQTIRYAEAYLVLQKAGLSIEGRAVARSALEHAATTQYAYLTADGLDMLAKSADLAEWSYLDRLYRWTGIPNHAPGEKPVGAGQLPSVSGKNGILAKLDPGADLLEPAYGVLSQAVHVTSSTVTGYFKKLDDGRLQLNHHRQDELADYTIYIVAASCMLVGWVYADTMQDTSKLAELAFRAEQLQLPLKLEGDWAEALWGSIDDFIDERTDKPQ